MSDLRLNLETPLPETIPAGQPGALFCLGTCFHRHHDLSRVEVLVDGEPHRVTAFAMPRFDLFSALHPQLGTGGEKGMPEVDPTSLEDPELRSYRSGFWATVPLPAASAGGSIALEVRARLDDGIEVTQPLGTVAVAEPLLDELETTGEGGLIAVCMATFNPDMGLFAAQLASLREQTDRNWRCFVSDDCSRPDVYRRIEAELAGDERFVLSRSERRLGVYRSFERALGMVPREATLVALSDQDDRWYPEKLARLRQGIRGAELVYSDQRLVDASGAVLAETYWSARRNNHTNITSLLVANTITGAASLMRREVVNRALPFPEVPGEQYHDHWLGLVAMSLGDVAFIDEPLYDYVQHGGAALGHVAANAGIPSGGARSRLELFRPRHLRRVLATSPYAYFFSYLRLAVLAQVLLARCGGRMTRRKRRALRRFIAAERSPLGAALLFMRVARPLVGLNETFGIERVLAQGIAWRHALEIRARGVRRPAGWTYDASLPVMGEGSAAAHREPETTHIQSIIEPLQLSVSEREPERINLLIPTIDLKHLFGGYIAKFNLARRLAESGQRIRVVAVDRTPLLPPDWREQVEAYSGLSGALSKFEVAFAREADSPLPINPRDRFIATTWWTAHVANAAVAETERERFLYLIQEYEPFTFEMGSLAALAMESYEFPHLALFSTELLREFFARHGYGVFAAGMDPGRRDSLSFQNAITPVVRPLAAELAQRDSRRLLFYARAEQHARRNMFELGLIAISRAIERGVFGPDWQFFGVGAVGGRSRVGLPGGAELEILTRKGQSDYGRMLGEHDVGLSLMFTPHPSLVPLEMASAGLITVTNSFDVKTPDAMAAISSNLITTRPTVEGVVAGLAEATSRVGQVDARVAGAQLKWSDDWDDSLNEPLVREINELMSRC